MDLGPCAKTHSVKLKTEYEDLSRKAEAEKDEHQIKIFNTFKADYEREVRAPSHPLPLLARICTNSTHSCASYRS